MSQIFISYSRKDSAFVDDLVHRLRRCNYRIWQDKTSIQGGHNWQQAITEGIKTSTGMIVVLSPDAVESEYVNIEINAALDAKIRVIPYVYRDCEALPFRLNQTHAFFHKSLDAFDQLVAELATLPTGAHAFTSKLADLNLIGKADKTFAQVAEQLDGSLNFTVNFKDAQVDLVGLPYKSTLYCMTYLIGRKIDTLEWQPRVQLALQFSQAIPGDTFPVEVAEHFLAEQRDFKLRLFLVRGPKHINFDKNRNSYRIMYGLDVKAEEEWEDAVTAAQTGLDIYSGAKRPDLQIFNMGPGALMYPLGLDHKNAVRAEVYQQDIDTKKYYRVFGNLD